MKKKKERKLVADFSFSTFPTQLSRGLLALPVPPTPTPSLSRYEDSVIKTHGEACWLTHSQRLVDTRTHSQAHGLTVELKMQQQGSLSSDSLSGKRQKLNVCLSHHSVVRVCLCLSPPHPLPRIIFHLVSPPPFIDDTFFSPLSCFPGFSLSSSLPVPVCPFSFSCLLFFFLPVYAHRCRCCAVKKVIMTVFVG